MAAVMGYTCTSRRQSADPSAAPQIPHALAHVAREPGSVKHFPVNRHDVGQPSFHTNVSLEFCCQCL